MRKNTQEGNEEEQPTQPRNIDNQTGRRQYLKWMATAGITSTTLVGAGASTARADRPSVTELTIKEPTDQKEIVAPPAYLEVTFTWTTETYAWSESYEAPNSRITITLDPVVEETFHYEGFHTRDEIVTRTKTETIILPGDSPDGDYDLTVLAETPIGDGSWGNGQQETVENVISIGGAERESDLTIDRLRPVQTVFNADVNDDDTLDLVKGKSTAVLVYPGGTDLDKLDQNVTIRSIVKDGTDIEFVDGISITSEEYRSLAEDNDYKVLPVEVPESGTRVIEAEVQPEGEIDSNPENNRVGEEVSVVETGPLKLAYYRIQEPESGIPYMDPTPDYEVVSKSDYEDHVKKCDELLPARLPLAEERLESSAEGTGLGSQIPGTTGIRELLAAIDMGTWLHTDGALGVGVVTQDFFVEHGQPEATGITEKGVGSSNASLVVEGYYDTTAHELGHNFGLHTETEEYLQTDGPDTGDGYWVEKNQLIEDWRAFMSGSIQYSDHFWISNEINYDSDFKDYDVIFDKLRDGPVPTVDTSISSNEDMDIIYLLGLVQQDDTIKKINTYFFDEGSLLDTGDGPYSFVGRDNSGNIVTDLSFDLSFELLAAEPTRPESPIETDVAAFSFPMQYPETVRTIEFTKNGEVLEEYDATTSVLHQAIDAIPTDGIKENQRKTLHNKIDAIERQLTNENERAAAKKLQNDLRKSIKRWVASDYTLESPKHYTREQVLEVVDNHIERLD